MKYIALLILLQQCLSFSQSALVIYTSSFNSQKMVDVPDIKLVYKNNISVFYDVIESAQKRYDEINWFDYNEKNVYQSVLNKEGIRYSTVEKFENYPKPEITDETTEILGYKCTKAKVVIRSNNIDIWFTKDSGLKGSPVVNIGHELGLVMKIVRNGNYITEAVNIDKNADVSMIKVPSEPGNFVNAAEYKFRVTENNYKVFSIFESEKINYGDTIVNPADDTEDISYRYSKGTVILKKIKLPENVNGQTIFAELTEMSNGDAYDRTGSLFVIPMNMKNNFLNALKNGIKELPVTKGNNGKNYQGIKLEEDYEPPIELMRFITPFGINKYNEQVKVFRLSWQDSVTYKMDISELAGILKDEVYIGLYIGCYDRGGHMVSLRLKYHPDDVFNEKKGNNNFWIKPLINTLNIMEMSGQEYGSIFESDTLKVRFIVPEGVNNIHLRYITTGHGGWDNGDEFNKRMNEIYVDNEKIYKFIPWRTDCGTFREYNPASGNFINGISSSDFSRSNWCPGQVVIPEDIIIGDISAGSHVLKIFIPMGKPEGSSFSSWNVSAILIGSRK